MALSLVPIHFIRHPLHMPQRLTTPQAQRRFSQLRRKVVRTLKDHEEGWRETIDILSDPALMKDLREAIAETETLPMEMLHTDERIPNN